MMSNGICAISSPPLAPSAQARGEGNGSCLAADAEVVRWWSSKKTTSASAPCRTHSLFPSCPPHEPPRPPTAVGASPRDNRRLIRHLGQLPPTQQQQLLDNVRILLFT